MQSIARNFDFGIELHETGLNTISAELFRQNPKLFEVRQDIPIDSATGRVLALYAVLREPLLFDLYPLSSGALSRDRFYVLGKLEFTLTDVLPGGGGMGLITRLRADIEADLSLSVSDSVQNKQYRFTIDDARFVNLEGDHPISRGASIRLRKVDLSPILRLHSNAGELSSDPAFVALLNYVIEVFLKSGLEKPVAQFPLPPLNLMLTTKIVLTMRGAMIDGNHLGAYLLSYPGGVIPVAGPPPLSGSDLSLGMVKQTLSAILQAGLPVRSNIDPTDPNALFSIGSGSWLEVDRRSNIDLAAPLTVLGQVFFNGLINAQLNVKLGDYWVRPSFPIPIGQGFIHGNFNPFIKANHDSYELILRPSPHFFDVSAIVIITDYVSYIHDAVKSWLEDHVDPIFEWIPLIGWIIAKGVDEIVSGLVAIFMGVPLSIAVSILLTSLLTVAVNILRLVWGELLDFSAYTLPRKLPILGVDIDIRSIDAIEVVDNQGGELVVEGSFTRVGAPRPEPPVPSLPLPFEGSYNPPAPATAPADSYEPTFPMTAPGWIPGAALRYTVQSSSSGVTTTSTQTLEAEQGQDPGTVLLSIESVDSSGVTTGKSSVLYDTRGNRLLKETDVTDIKGGEKSYRMETSIVYGAAGARTTCEILLNGSSYRSESVETPMASIFPRSATIQTFMRELTVGTQGIIAVLAIDFSKPAGSLLRFDAIGATVTGKTRIVVGPNEVDCTVVQLRSGTLKGVVTVQTDAPHAVESSELALGTMEVKATLQN